MTALLTTHDMVDMEKLVNRVIVIGSGKIMYDGTIHGLRETYGQSRRIDVTFGEAEPKFAIDGLCEVAREPFRVSYEFNPQTLSAGRVMALLSEQPFEIRDIAIQEADIEAIIRRLYTGRGGDAR